MALIPKYQEEIDDAMDELKLSDERRTGLQSFIEGYIQVGGIKNDAGEITDYEMRIVDNDNATRDDVSIADLVAEAHKKVEDNTIPVLPHDTLLTVKQLQEVAEGKLRIGLTVHQKLDDKVLNGSEAMTLEDISSGKVKFNISK